MRQDCIDSFAMYRDGIRTCVAVGLTIGATLFKKNVWKFKIEFYAASLLNSVTRLGDLLEFGQVF